MRAIWSGQIVFGLVTVPVKLYGATEKHDVAFHQVHDADAGRIKYERVCSKCGEKVSFADIDKAYDDGEQTIVLTDEDLASLPSEQRDEIEVVQFVPGEQVDPIMLDTPYYLEPAGKAPKSYVLLRTTLEKAELTAIVRFTLRSKTRLGVLRARGDVLVLQTLLWAEDIREADFATPAASVKVSDKELAMSDALVQQFAGDFHPEEFTDDYQAELRKLIDAKLAEGGGAVDTEATFGDQPEEGGGGKVLSLLEALEGSLKQRGAAVPAGGNGAGEADTPATSAPTKKAAANAAAKKSTAKETPARKGPAKKTAAKRTSAKKPA